MRRKLPALSSLFDYSLWAQCRRRQPGGGVKRPATNNNEGSTPALDDAQSRQLLEARAPDTPKGIRDREYSPPCSITASGVKNCACCDCAIFRAARV